MENETTENTELDSSLYALCSSLLKKRDEAVEFRAASGVERRWREDEELFDGADPGRGNSMIDYATGEASIPTTEARRSKVVVNIVRAKCEMAEGRFADIQLPTDDRNWGLKITPVPEMVRAMKDERPAGFQGQPVLDDDGQPVRMADIARQDRDGMTDRMKNMESEIDDQLTECNYNGESRKSIRSSVRLGTGILKGPNVIKRIKKAWSDTPDGFALSIEEDHRPESRAVDVWNVYPAPETEEDIRKAPYIWERDTILPRDLRNLVGVDGYMDDQIIKILREEPVKIVSKYDSKHNRHYVRRITAQGQSALERWDYYGDLTRDDLEILGVDTSHDDVSVQFSACIVFVNDRPIKALLNPLDTGDMPYDFFNWTPVSGSPWGIGIPRMMAWQQRILNAAWRAMMDNAGDSAGANIAVLHGIEPADGKWEITGKKLWLADSDIDDARKAFVQFQLETRQPELERIIDLALRFTDMETSLPMLFQGEQAQAPETLGATNIMVDSNNVALRIRVKRYDDCITRPHLRRYYDYNMQHNQRDDIKGDFNVDVRGASVLLEKDQQAQTLMQVLQAKQDPDINLLVDWEKASKRLFAALKLEDILKSDEDYAQAKKQAQEQQAPQDPRIAAAQVKAEADAQKAQLNQQAIQMRAEAEMAKAQMVQQSDMAEIETKGQMTQAQIEQKILDAQRDREHELIMKDMDLQMKMLEFSNAKGISLDKIKAQLTTDEMKMKLQKYLADRDGRAEQVVSPPTEPVGRAEDGKAYQQ